MYENVCVIIIKKENMLKPPRDTIYKLTRMAKTYQVPKYKYSNESYQTMLPVVSAGKQFLQYSKIKDAHTV